MGFDLVMERSVIVMDLVRASTMEKELVQASGN